MRKPDNEIVANVARDIEQRARGEDDLSNLQSKVKEFKKLLVIAFDKHCDYSQYTQMYQLLDYMVKYKQRFVTVSVLDSGLYEHFNLHIKQVYNITSQRRQKSILETVGVMEIRYEMELSYEKK